MEENVIVFKYKELFQGKDLFLTIPKENEVAYGLNGDDNILIVHSSNEAVAQTKLHEIQRDYALDKLEMTGPAVDLFEQGVDIVFAKKSLETGKLSFFPQTV